MEIESYINKWYYDSDGGKYFARNILSYDGRSVFLLTEKNEIIKICFSIEKQEEYKKRIEILSESFEKICALPWVQEIRVPKTAKELFGLKSSEYGYVFSTGKNTNLNFFIKRPKDEKFLRWYFEKTGGILTRLRIAYCLGIVIKNINEIGFSIGDLSPHNILLEKYQPTRYNPNVEIANLENFSSKNIFAEYGGADLYYDPLVYKNIKMNSFSADTYAFSVILFQLLTTLHPFIGSECENLSEEEIVEKINSGELDYIGATNTNNTNSRFDELKVFIPQNVQGLFEKMFTIGKERESKRPTLEEILDEILIGLGKVVRCGCCNQEFICYDKDGTCPYCDEKNYFKSVEIYKIIKTNGIEPGEKVEMTNKYFLNIGTNNILKKTIDPHASSLDKLPVISLEYSSNGEITVLNRFKKQSIKVLDCEIPARYKKTFSRESIRNKELKIKIEFSDLTHEEYKKYVEDFCEISIRYEIVIK